MKTLYTKILLTSCISLFMISLSFGQTTLYSQGFETNLSGYSHTPSQTPSSDPGDQYFHRAEPSDNDIYESGGPYTNVTGSWMFVGSNPNSINSGSPGVLTLGSGINVSGFSSLELSIDFGAVPNDWDDSDELIVEYSWDNSAWSALYSFGHSNGFNDPLDLIGNATGGSNTANGTTLTYALQTITSTNFTGSGTTLYLRVVCDSGANYEAFGLDNVVLTGVGASTPSVGFDSPTSAENETNSTFSVNIPVTLSNFSTNVDLSVTVDGASTAESGDYTLNTSSLNFTANGTLNVSLDINDDADSDDETIILEIAETTSTGITITTSQHTVTVTDDDLPTVTIPYSEDFSNCATQEWSVFTVGAEQEWFCDANGYFEANAFGSSGAADDYLVSPVFDMDAQTGENLTFTSWTRFADATSPQIELLYTTNFTGDPATTTWNSSLSPTWPAPDSQTNTGSGNVDVSGISGTAVHFAFRYTSTGTGGGTTEAWRIEDFDIISGTTPTITLSETALTGLDYVDGSGPSAEQTFTAEGSNLSADITLTAPTNFQISTTSGSGFGSSVTLNETGGTVASTTIYVRLDSGLAVDTYSGTLAATSTGAIQQDVSLSGEVTFASCAGTATTFPFNGVSGATNLEHSSSNLPGTSGEDCGTNYLIYYETSPSTDGGGNYLRSNATDGLIESADWGGEAKFETFAIDVSGETSVDVETFGNTTGSGFNAGGEQLQWWYKLDGGAETNLGSAISGTGSLAVGPTTIDVTGVNDIIVGFTFDMNGGSDGFEDVDVTVTATPTTPTIVLSETALSALDYVDGSGPSAEQTFTAEGSNLTGDISITAPTDFQVSTTSGSGFGSSVTLTQSGGSVTPTTIYVRLVFGLTVNTYSGTLTATSTGATQQDVSLSGEVTAASCAGSSTPFPFNGVSGTTNLEHDSSNLPGSSGEDCGTNYLIYYDTTPSTDSGGNYFRSNTVDGLIESADWGGEGKFETFAIDVSSETSVDIETFGNTTGVGFNAGGEEFQWWYTLDGGSQVNLGTAITGTGSLAVGPTTVDVTGGNDLIVGFTFNMNGGSDGFEDVDVTVTGSPTIYTYDNGWNTNPVGVSTSANDIEVLNGTADIAGTLIGNNLTVSSGATLNLEPTTTTPSAILDLAGDIDNDGTIIFRSNVNGSAQLDEFTGSITTGVTGAVTAERFIPAGDNNRRAYRFLTSTVDSDASINANWQEGVNNTGTNFPTDNQNPNPGFGIHISGSTTGANGFDATGSGEPSMYTFNNGFEPTGSQTQQDAWTELPDTDTKTLKAGEAYLTFVRGDRSVDVTNSATVPTNTTLRATGDLHTGSREFSSANNVSTPEYGLSDEADLFSLVGNPYQAIVDINKLTPDFSNVNINSYWVWDPNLGSRGNYSTVSLPSGTGTSGPANQFIQPGQSFFVQTVADGAASLTFNENDKDVMGGATAIFSEQDNPSLKLLLYTSSAYNAGERETDGLLINFENNANNDLDSLDADKLQGPDESLARLHGNDLISIEHRAMPVNDENLALSTTGYTEENYMFVVNAVNIQNNFEAFLLDNYTGNTSQLNEGATAVSFIVDSNIPESISENRFSLVFDNTTLGIDDNTFGENFSIYPNPTSNGQFSIKTPNISGEVSIEITNMLGQQVSTQQLVIEGQQVDVNAGNLSTGVYVVKLSKDNQSFSAKLIVE